MRGDFVIARAFKGEPIVRRVWDENDRGVWLTDDKEFDLLTTGRGGHEPMLGFPREDVFRFDPDVAMLIKIAPENCDWAKLVPY
jgi:hypothetical protein